MLMCERNTSLKRSLRAGKLTEVNIHLLSAMCSFQCWFVPSRTSRSQEAGLAIPRKYPDDILDLSATSFIITHNLPGIRFAALVGIDDIGSTEHSHRLGRTCNQRLHRRH